MCYQAAMLLKILVFVIKHFLLDCPRVIKKPDGSLVPTLFYNQYLVLPIHVYLCKQLLHLVLPLQPSQDTFIARLIPVVFLKAAYLFTILNPVIKLIHDFGGQVFGIMSDNLSV